MTTDEFSNKIEAMRRQIVEMQRSAPADATTKHEPALEELYTALEELNIAEEELRDRGEELVQARQKLDAERQRYRDLFEFAPDGYLVTDVSGIIWEANRAAGSLLKIRSDLSSDGRCASLSRPKLKRS